MGVYLICKGCNIKQLYENYTITDGLYTEKATCPKCNYKFNARAIIIELNSKDILFTREFACKHYLK